MFKSLLLLSVCRNIYSLLKVIGTLPPFKEKLCSIQNESLQIKNRSVRLSFLKENFWNPKIILTWYSRIFLEINLRVREFKIQVVEIVLFVFTKLLTKLIGSIFHVFCEKRHRGNYNWQFKIKKTDTPKSWKGRTQDI